MAFIPYGVKIMLYDRPHPGLQVVGVLEAPAHLTSRDSAAT